MGDARPGTLRSAALPGFLMTGLVAMTLVAGAVMVPATVASADDAVSREDFIVSRTRMDAEAEHVRKGKWRLGDDMRRERRELSEQAQQLHDDAKAVGETDAPGMTRLARRMDELRGRLEDFQERADSAAMGQAPDASASEPAAPETTAREPMAEPTPVEPDPGTMQPISVITRYNDLVQDVLWASSGLSAVENGRVDALRAEGNGLVHDIRQNAQRNHEQREASVERLYEVGTELRSLYDLAMSNRRHGLPLVEAGRTVVGWTAVGTADGSFEVLRTRFIRPGSAYVTVKNSSEEARPYAISLEFTDVVGDSTGTAAWVSRPLEDLKPGEVREVLVAIAPAVDRFWDVTTDYTVSVQ